MKKTIVVVLALAMVVGFALTASAEVENIFGGYWRTRFWDQQNMMGAEQYNNTQAGAMSVVDTRTRLYYTAKFSDDFKFVNKFEFDAAWGDNNWGDVGADGVRIEIKNSYVDFNTGPVNWKVGVQGVTVARGFVFSDDIAGVIATPKFGEAFSLPVGWMRISGADAGGLGQGGAPDIYGGGGGQFAWSSSAELPTGYVAAGDANVDLLYLQPTFKMGAMGFDIPILYLNTGGGSQPESDWYYAGVDFDLKTDVFNLWATGLYNGGTIDRNVFGATDDLDVSGYLLAVGVNGAAGPLGWWAQGWYASGQDPNSTSNDVDAFVPIGVPGGSGSSYYWSEIMGLGVFDNFASAGSPGDHITNMYAVGVGADFGLTDSLKLKGGLWYASLVEPWYVGGDKDLGVELDVTLVVKVVENLDLQIIGAYQMAGDAVILEPTAAGDPTKNQDDPYIIGTQLSFSF